MAFKKCRFVAPVQYLQAFGSIAESEQAHAWKIGKYICIELGIVTCLKIKQLQCKNTFCLCFESLELTFKSFRVIPLPILQSSDKE